MRLRVHEGHEIRRNHPPAALAGKPRRPRPWAHRRGEDRRMRLLERLDHPAVTEAGVDRLFELDRPELALDVPGRSEERRVGKECVSTCRSRWSPEHSNKKKYE